MMQEILLLIIGIWLGFALFVGASFVLDHDDDTSMIIRVLAYVCICFKINMYIFMLLWESLEIISDSKSS